MTANGDDKNELDLAAFIAGSDYRKLVISGLLEDAKQPSDLADEGDAARSHVSRALSELRERNLVREHGGGTRAKLYSLTDLGRRVAEHISFDK
ncbi:winged helix DNA-binding protein [Haloarcula rubripromontorii]